MLEIWKDINGFEGMYQVSNLGRIKSFHWHMEKIIKPKRMKNGYLIVCIHKNKTSKMRTVHRLVAQAFIPNVENKPHVNHKNGIKTDNRVNNLEWCTMSENMRHAYRTGLRKYTSYNAQRSKEALGIPVMCIETGKTFQSITEAGDGNRIRARHIGRCVRGERKTAYGYHWKAVEEI